MRWAKARPRPTKPRASSKPCNAYYQVESAILPTWTDRGSTHDDELRAAINGLGFALLNQGNPKEARPLFERILALEPNSPGPLNGLARCLRDEGDLDGANKVWERALKISPGPNDCSYSLGLAYVQQGQLSKAIPLLEMSLQANPNDPQIKHALEKARAAKK